MREAVLTDDELTERQKQMLIEIYESFRKETLMARAGPASVTDDQTGLEPDEAGLVWPHDRSTVAAITGRARLALTATAAAGDEDPRDAWSWSADEEVAAAADEFTAAGPWSVPPAPREQAVDRPEDESGGGAIRSRQGQAAGSVEPCLVSRTTARLITFSTRSSSRDS